MTHRQEFREKHRRQEQNQRIALITFILVALLLIVFYVIYPSIKPIGVVNQGLDITRPQVNFNAMGDPNAPIKIIEYADFQCPYCAEFYKETEPQIIETYVKTGKVYFEYHSFGQFIGSESVRAGEAAYCAGDQGKFWEYHDVLFANQGAENSGAFVDRRLVAFAQAINLDVSTFSDCLSNDKYANMVTQDGVEARKIGLRSTPSFLVNGKILEGALPFSNFQNEIESALRNAGSN